MNSDQSSCENKNPNHVAIVMDGNGRWAKAQGKTRIFGHRAGVEIVRKIVRHAVNRGTKHLTLYSFSTENWKRPKDEIQALFGLLKSFIQKDMEQLNKENVQITVLGNKSNLPKDLQKLLHGVEEATKNNTGLFLNVAFNYGGRDEIVRMVQNLAQRVADNSLSIEQICEQTVADTLDTKSQPDPDMIIRTSGEHRLSNFLLWQSAYSEFILLDVLWPDFSTDDYDRALEIFKSRQRRLGGA